jgi:hypothetical protein
MHHSASQDRLVFPADVTLRLARAIAVVSCDQKAKKANMWNGTNELVGPLRLQCQNPRSSVKEREVAPSATCV